MAMGPCVIPRRSARCSCPPSKVATASISGMFAAIMSVGIANPVLRFRPVWPSNAPTRLWVRLSICFSWPNGHAMAIPRYRCEEFCLRRGAWGTEGIRSYATDGCLSSTRTESEHQLREHLLKNPFASSVVEMPSGHARPEWVTHPLKTISSAASAPLRANPKLPGALLRLSRSAPWRGACRDQRSCLHLRIYSAPQPHH